jgi:aminoglycoside 6'-N-acetyltransferase
VLAEERTEVFVVAVDGVDGGIVQRYRTADDPQWRATLQAADPATAALDSAGLDYLIGVESLRGRGVGSVLLQAFTDALLAEWADIEAVVTSVLAENVASWRVLENAGFVRTWSGQLASDDPSDQGESYLMVRRR